MLAVSDILSTLKTGFLKGQDLQAWNRECRRIAHGGGSIP
jgi:hypothetical protein